MKHFRASLSPLLLFGLCATALPAQTPAAAKRDRDPEVVKLLKDLNEAIMDKKMARDSAAQNLIDKLLTAAQAEAPKDMVPKDKDALVAGLSDVYFKALQRKPEQKAIYETVAFALGKLGAPGAKVLKAAYTDERFKDRDWVDLRAKFLDFIGRTKDESMIQFLVERAVRESFDPLLKAAGGALGNFDGSSGKVRKDICKELIKKFNEVHNSADKSVDAGDAQAKASRDTRAAILDSWNETLGKLTKQSFNKAPEWLHWWNKNKDLDWEKKK